MPVFSPYSLELESLEALLELELALES